MKALVTGGTGFIGRRLVRQLVAQYGVDAVACLVKPPVTPLEAAALDAFRGQGLQLIEGELMARPVAAQPPPAVDVVFHLAANIDTDAPLEALRVNQQRYSVGVGTFVDVLTSQQNVIIARQGLISARLNYRNARAQIEATIGRDLQ